MLSLDAMSRFMEDVDRRLRQLETSGKMGNVTLSDGAFEVRDSAGEVRVRIGFDPTTGQFLGVSVRDAAGVWARIDVAATGRRLGVAAPPTPTLITGAGSWSAVTGPEAIVETSTGQIVVQSTVTLSEIEFDGVMIGTEIRDAAGTTTVVAPVNGPGNGSTLCPNLRPTGFPVAVAGFWTLAPGTYRIRHRFFTGGASYAARMDAVVMTVTPT